MTRDLHSERPTTSPHIRGAAAPSRQERGRRIVEGEGQVRRINDHTYEVKSQTWSNRTYEVIHTEHGWLCSCPDSIEANQHCKHAYAVEISRSMRQAVQDGITIRTVDPTKCKLCESKNITKKGIRHFKKGDMQQYKCKDCKKRFVHNLGFERRHATPEQVSTGIELFFAGMSSRKVATTLKGMGVRISHVTVQNWAAAYAGIMERFADSILPAWGSSGERTKCMYQSRATPGTSLPCWTPRPATG